MALDLDKLAAQFGGSIVQPQQTGGAGAILQGLSPKDQAEIRMNNYRADQKRISDLDSTITGAAPTVSDLNKFIQLNRDEGTGSLWNNITPNSVPMLHSDNTNQMIAIQSRLGPSQRAVGSGSSSDRDVSLFMSGLPSTDKGGKANDAIRKDFQRKYDYAVNKKTFLSNYLQSNGSLQGADAAWQQMPDYQAYINGQDLNSYQPAKQSAPTQSLDLSSLAAQEIARRKGRK